MAAEEHPPTDFPGGKQPATKTILAKIWMDAGDRVISICAEIMVSSTLLFGLLLFFLFMRVMRAIGYKAEWVSALETVDFGAAFIVLLNFSLRFALQAIVGTWWKPKSHE